MTLRLVGEAKCFGGWQRRYRHQSRACACEMAFAIYLPPQAEHGPVPAAYWLSGLTCTDENFITKAGAQREAARLGLAIFCPDTSPRGEGVPDAEGYDLGQGAGFYLNATQEPWSRHFHMGDYIGEELPALVEASFPVTRSRSIFGHSMGGHGALVTALRQPGRWRAVSAFSPVCRPMNCPWGERAFTAYLGADLAAWREWDACELLGAAREKLPLLVDQGEADEFLDRQLKPDALAHAAQAAGHPLSLRRHPGYDHSYYFIASFMADHLDHHVRALLE